MYLCSTKKYVQKVLSSVEMSYLTKYVLFKHLVSKNELVNYNKDFI